MPPYKARPDLLQLLENSRFQNGLSTAASLGEATGLQGDSGAFPTFHQCGQLHQSGQLQPTRPRLQGGAHSVHCTSVHLCTHLNTCFRYVHILSTAQLLLNVFIWRHCGDLQCAVATWTLWTLCTLFDGDSSNSRDTLDTAVDNGLQCESWLFCALAKIFCKNHSGNPHSKASAPNTNWRLQMEKASLPPSWYFREVVRNKLASLEATLVRNSADWLTHSLTDRGKV